MNARQRTLAMFVGVVALCYQCVELIMECHNSHKHSQSLLTRVVRKPIYTFHKYVLRGIVNF